jgi:broad specificity phosphatase PhoE
MAGGHWVMDRYFGTEQSPLTATGKLQKLALRQRFGKHYVNAPTSA